MREVSTIGRRAAEAGREIGGLEIGWWQLKYVLFSPRNF